MTNERIDKLVFEFQKALQGINPDVDLDYIIRVQIEILEELKSLKLATTRTKFLKKIG